jgi:hypothetical protein
MRKRYSKQASCLGNTYFVIPAVDRFYRECWVVRVADGNRRDPGEWLGDKYSLAAVKTLLRQHAGSPDAKVTLVNVETPKET